MAQPSYAQPTFPLTDEVFKAFQQITLEQTGISLSSTKRAMIATRFTRRVKSLGLDGFEEYLRLVQSVNHPERANFIDTVTTNLTYFFRESHHFESLKKDILPALHDLPRLGEKPIRIWSAGCSSGQEPYSIAMMAGEAEAKIKRQVRILCTDIHTEMVKQTENGIYKVTELRGLNDAQKKRWFESIGGQKVQATNELRSMLRCKQMNLFDPWPIKGGVDVIFCRNTLIYFSVERQTRIIRGFAKLQKPGSKLFIGHSETIRQCSDVYERTANTSYVRL